MSFKTIQKANTIEELNEIKKEFLSECEKRENKIKVSNLIKQIENFCGAKSLFEAIAPSLMSKRGGKGVINEYVKVIKENQSLKTIYAYYEGLNANNTSELKKSYITEALSIGDKVDLKEYIDGASKVIKLLVEGFNMLGDEFVLKNVSHDEKSNIIGESLLYLSTTKKTIKNLNEYISHIDIVSDVINENKKDSIDVDLSLEDIVKNMNECIKESNVSNIFETDNKEKTFKDTKKVCLEMISNQKNNTNDSEIVNKLNEMEDKLNKKEYSFDTFTKDMLYMTELQEVLK